MAISSSVVAGVVLIAAGSAGFLVPWMGDNRPAAFPAGSTTPSAVADCARPLLTVTTASGQSPGAAFICDFGKLYPHASWEAFANSFSH